MGGALGTAPPARARSVANSPAREECWDGDWPPRLRAAVADAMTAAVGHARAARWPFGAVLVDPADGSVVLGAGNSAEGGDVTAHAEVNLLRKAVAAGVPLRPCVVVSTAEPCPMCAGALVWSEVRGVAYGTSIAYLVSRGFPQMRVPFGEIVARSTLPRPSLAHHIRTDLTDPLYRAVPG
ncbi:deaminase [Streptomyces sp. HU2014]|uniref:CMP/dCMP-type deaminase domain-containing protein n=1 Tax=Streptomyces albireticuli TaxID=1940 RepID=A0A1Z2L1M7_9ACTN|nr:MULTISPECIES: deaminase [Streptomyces]ARZ68200.1 hypothetical protein SMD11_2551 [Streptomyces albireticuli]UQI48177.1 deaminase [Streptomyces sp. HU2014]